MILASVSFCVRLYNDLPPFGHVLKGMQKPVMAVLPENPRISAISNTTKML
jgi:hypothetical protein